MASNTLVDAINSIATDTRVRLAMLMGAYLESGWNTSAVGDGGKSHGAYQIYQVEHPGVSVAQAQDPVYSTRYMLSAYQAGVNRVDTALWNSNPKQAAALAAFYAERPKVMYPQDRIDKAWGPVQGALSGSVGGTDSLTNPLDGADQGITDLWNRTTRWISDKFGELVDYMYFAALYFAGGVTIAVGFYLLMKDSTRVVPAAKAVAQGYKAVLPI